jgi:hypothetical protein
VNNTGPEVANAFSLQLNSQFFSGSPACSGSGNPSGCQAWQQFVYDYDNATGYVFMQYWLINYNATCPSGWNTSSNDCWINSPASTLTGGPLTAGNLASVKLSGSATSGGNDAVSLSIGSGQATLVTTPTACSIFQPRGTQLSGVCSATAEAARRTSAPAQRWRRGRP